MKKSILFSALLVTTLSFAQNEDNKNIGVFVERTYTDLGKILDFKSSLVSIKNLSSGATETHLIIETRGFASNDVKNIELNKAGAEELMANMKSLKSKYFGTTPTGAIEVSFTSTLGHEIGGAFVLDKPSSSTPVTKKEKYYVDTKEKYYEGKIVNHDASGTYIWKEMTSTGSAVVSGKWVPFIRLNNNSSKTIFNLTLDEFDTFIKFLEENSSKL